MLGFLFVISKFLVMQKGVLNLLNVKINSGREKIFLKIWCFQKNVILLHSKTGKCCTASSLQILQGLTAAKVVGCSGAMQRAYPPRLFSSVGQST